jgi:hypothetical protein
MLMVTCSAIRAAAVDELTREQAQQVADNFHALRDSLEQGKAEIEKVQHRFAQIKQTGAWLNDNNYGRELQQVIANLEQNGLSAKLEAAHQSLDTISRSASLINDKAEQIKGQYGKVREFYDRWHPDRHNPVRPLELVANGLGELESIIQKIDPSPDNILTKPITAFINYYQQASQAFAGALTRVQEQIEQRRQNCIGTGCENYSAKGEAFSAKFTGVGPAWSYRPLQEGEIWYDGDGRAFLWWHDRWEELQGGLTRFEEVYRGWRLAHGQVISTSNLLARMNRNYNSVLEAKQRAAGYWDILSSSNSCHAEVFTVLQQRNVDRDRTLANANNDRETFIARYMFLQNARGNIDELVNAFTNTLLVRGMITDDNGNSVEAARINANSPAGTASATSTAGGWFSLQFNLRPDDASRQNAAVSVSHNDYASSETDQRLWQQCEDWHITLSSRDGDAESESVAELQSIRDSALFRAAEIDSLCQTIRSDSDQISAWLETVAGNDNQPPVAAETSGNDGLAELAQQAGELASESETLAQALAVSSQALSSRVNSVCEQADLLQLAADDNSRQQLYRGIKANQDQARGDLAPLRSGFMILNTFAEQAGAIKTRTDTLREAVPPNNPEPQQQQTEEQLETMRRVLARAQNASAAASAGLQELETFSARAALIIRRQATGQDVTQLVSIFGEITSAGDRANACIQDSTAQLDPLAGRIEALTPGTEGTVAATGKTLEAAEQAAALDRITGLADTVINNAFIAGRFFSVAKMQDKLAEGAACLVRAEGAPDQPEQDDNSDRRSASGEAADNPVCQRYQQALVELGNRQMSYAAQAQQVRTEAQAKALHARVMGNSRQIVATFDAARAAGCHDTQIPPEVRANLGMPPG